SFNINKLTVNGKYSSKTAEAVANFQASVGLTANGVLDAKTFYQLENDYMSRNNMQIIPPLQTEKLAFTPNAETGGGSSFPKGTGKTPTTVSDNGLNFIANMEVGKGDLVLDSNGNIIEIKPTVNNTTIGYGYDLTKDPLNLGIKTAKNISQADALDYLKRVSNQYAQVIANSKDITITLNQQQLDALVALKYNIGSLGVVPNLLSDINTNASYSTIQNDIYAYYNSLVQINPNNSKYLQGWKNRADTILDAYFYGNYGSMPINAVKGVYK
ncbi:MAG: putative peptidoglycan binding domain, partial [Clostridiaceae bacterium]|nr:putative peptidoglycan binding domain [Clostridiaceae bacterium]